MIDAIDNDNIDSGFNKELSACVERLSLINISNYKVRNSVKVEYTYQGALYSIYRPIV